MIARAIAPLALLSGYSYIGEMGWVRSATARRPVDVDGQPIPWMTYGLIRFLDKRLPASIDVFEYGAGNSTLWWSQRARSVVCCEDDAEWLAVLHEDLPPNVETLHEPDPISDRYARAVSDTERRFHVVVVDGRNRQECATHARQALTADGIVIWDNTDRERYGVGLAAYAEAGFRRVDFFGLGPVNASPEQSSILYRDGNWLGL